MTTINAAFTIEGAATGVSATTSQMVGVVVTKNTTASFAIVDPAGIKSATWEIVGLSAHFTAPTITATGTPSGVTATCPVPDADGVAVGIRCRAIGPNGAETTHEGYFYTADGDFIPFPDGLTHSGYNLNAMLQLGVGGEGGGESEPATQLQAKCARTTNVASLAGLGTSGDGIAASTGGDIIFLTAQDDATENGPWAVASGSWTRPAGFTAGTDASGVMVVVQQGDTMSDTLWLCTTNSGSAVVGTGSLAFKQLNGHALHVEDFGAKGGTTDDTAAFAAAIAAGKSQGKKVYALGPKYTANIEILGENVWLYGSGFGAIDGADTAIHAADDEVDVLAIGDGTTTTRSIHVYGIRTYGADTAEKGIKINGASDVHIGHFSARRFTEYDLYITSTAAQPTYAVYLDNFRLDQSSATSAVAFKADYGSGGGSYTTAVYIDRFFITQSSGGGDLVRLDGSLLRIEAGAGWIEAANGRGVVFGTTGTHLACDRVTIDSSSSSDVLVTIPENTQISAYISGTVRIDGKVGMPGGNTASLSTYNAFLGYKWRSHYMQSAGNLEFLDNSLSAWLRYDSSDQQVYISRSGAHLFINSGTGRVDVNTEAASYFRVSGGPGAQLDNGVLRFGLSADVAASGNIRAPEEWTVIGAADASGDRSIIDWTAGATGSDGDLTIGDVTNRSTTVLGGESANLHTTSGNGFEARASGTHRIVNDATNVALEIVASGATNGADVKFSVRNASPDGVVTPVGVATHVCFAGSKIYIHVSGSTWDEVAVV